MDRTTLAGTERRLALRDEERPLLAKSRWTAAELAVVAPLFAPFDAAFLAYTARDSSASNRAAYLRTARHLCGAMMLGLGCTYWGFDWDRLLPWRAVERVRHAPRALGWRQKWETEWSRVTATLFFLGALPYSEAIHQTYHRELAEKWLGRDRARAIEAEFVAAALAIGYRDERMLRKNGAGVLLSALVAAGKADPAALTKSDLEGWQARTRRSTRVARAGVTCVQRVLAAQGHLGGEEPRRQGGPPRGRFAWGRTPPAIAPTFERFLADFGTMREPGTVGSYRVALRRFGDWLGAHFPDVQALRELRRGHIEAYKVAVTTTMCCGDHTGVGAEFRTLNFGEPLSRAHQIRSLSCLRAFCTFIDALEYPDRPDRPLWLRGDTPRADEPLPRAIPDADWRRLTAALDALTPELAAAHRLALPYERGRAVLAVLFECGLRAGELCRLDTGCLIAARDPRTGEESHWLRVPVGKLHNDRMIPVRPGVVAAIDAWMRVRGPQPALVDRRTRRERDFLFTWQGASLSADGLNRAIARLCALAGTDATYTSHDWRHTLAVAWRRRGMRIETIGQLLGHKDLKMTLRYAAVMPETLRREFEEAFAAIDEEHRTTAQIRVVLSPEAALAAREQWRESLWVDVGIGWCGLTAYLPCDARLACAGCPNHILDEERLPLAKRQRANLVQLQGLTGRLPPARRPEAERELSTAVAGLDAQIAHTEGATPEWSGASRSPADPDPSLARGGTDADRHVRHR